MRAARARISVINRAINLAIMPTSDLEQWDVADRWSAPLETFTTYRGDCEDYVIAKYVALQAAGVAPEDIKLVVVRNTDVSENHAVVAVRIDGAWVILDNRWLALASDREMRRATPLFEIDEYGVRQFMAPTANARLPDGALMANCPFAAGERPPHAGAKPLQSKELFVNLGRNYGNQRHGTNCFGPFRALSERRSHGRRSGFLPGRRLRLR
jgi:Bacterial transglutaminase-like cysteine proteinase BTLCP